MKTEVEEIVEDREYNKYRKPNGNTASNVIKKRQLGDIIAQGQNQHLTALTVIVKQY